MIMGDVCTRTCKFCAVKSGRPQALDPEEPYQVALWAKDIGFRHLVLTSVDRDDLSDLGAGHFAKTITLVKEHNPNTVVEVLTPDFQGKAQFIQQVIAAKPKVFNHNLETVARLTPKVRSASSYQRSLAVIQTVKQNDPQMITKSGLMLGLGETPAEIFETMTDLLEHGCDMLTLGQYLQPTQKHLAVAEYIHPDFFEELKQKGLKMGFRSVFSGPFVRSSYLADEVFHQDFAV